MGLSPKTASSSTNVFWRVEGSLLNLRAIRPVAFLARNAQSFVERWARYGGLGLLALLRPPFYVSNRVFATRALHTLLRGVSQDRLDLLGQEYFEYILKPRLKKRGVEKLKEWMAANGQVILVSQGLDHLMRPLAAHLGVERLVANRLDFRDGLATGRLLEPVIRPRGPLARLTGLNPDGRVSAEQLARDLGFDGGPEALEAAVVATERWRPPKPRPLVLFEPSKRVQRLSARQALAGRHILLIGVTGFIGKVWLAKVLRDLPEISKIYLLIRPQKGQTGQRRFEKLVEESPVFDAFHERYGCELAAFLGERIEVVEGDVSQPGLGMDEETRARLARSLDLIVNSSGLTEFNPDLRSGLAINVDAVAQLLEFLRQCPRAALLHLSTCYVVGGRDGRIREELAPDYTPAGVAGFDAEQERRALHELVKEAEARAESAEVTVELREQAWATSPGGRGLSAAALEKHIRVSRLRWLRNYLTEAGTRRARELGWPNTYTFTKSLAESVIARFGAGLPIAVVRPSIVETSTEHPFRGWNEGINTSASLSYLLGTFFRQLPSNERKLLDLIPVDLVCRGMLLIAAALVERCHEKVYQLATSAVNPCDMRRSIELTGLAHRKHYRALKDFSHRLKLRFDTISVSKERYQRLSAPAQRAVVRGLLRFPFLNQEALVRREKLLERVEKLIELYEPFILHNEQVFEAEKVELLAEALPREEKAAFGYDALSVDWWEYWINIHVPALRKWSYPLIEGRRLETRPRRHFQMPPMSKTPAAAGRSEAPWPSS